MPFCPSMCFFFGGGSPIWFSFHTIIYFIVVLTKFLFLLISLCCEKQLRNYILFLHILIFSIWMSCFPVTPYFPSFFFISLSLFPSSILSFPSPLLPSFPLLQYICITVMLFLSSCLSLGYSAYKFFCLCIEWMNPDSPLDTSLFSLPR